jgi:biopolymer transport protein ExbD
MASIDTGGGDGGHHKKGPGVKKAKKLSTRIDMTPMVDLGFLLITFFIFTTTLKLNMPKDTDKEEEQNKAKESGALTIMLGKDNNVYYYEGQLKVDASGNNFKVTTMKKIREVILSKKADVLSRYTKNQACIDKKMGEWKSKGIQGKFLKDAEESCEQEDLVVVIKPNEEAAYKNVVGILDEMSICRVLKYALVKITAQENELIKITEAAAPGK